MHDLASVTASVLQHKGCRYVSTFYISDLQSLLAIVKTLQLQAEGGQVKGQSRKETKNFIHGLKQLESGLKMMRDNSGSSQFVPPKRSWPDSICSSLICSVSLYLTALLLVQQ